MNPTPNRKPDQQTCHGDGVAMPRATGDAGRVCDVDGCPEHARDLIAQDGGSVLFVCGSHALDLTAPRVEPDTEPAPAPAAKRWRVPRRVLLGGAGAVGVTGGLVLTAATAGLAGTAVGTAGMWLLLRSVLPRNR